MDIVVGKPFEHHTKLETQAQHATLALEVTDQVALSLNGKVMRVQYKPGNGWVIECASDVAVIWKPSEEILNSSISESDLRQARLSDLHKRLHG